MTTHIQEKSATPMMLQWQACKEVAKDALLFFRLGDFYEAFWQDAEIISSELELTLTKRQDVPMCGVPAFSIDNYIDRLVGKGFKVAIADQMEDPKACKGIVKREVTRIISPGTLIQSNLLSDKSHNFICSLTRLGNVFGVALLDLSCAYFKTFEVENQENLINLLYRVRPKEVLISNGFEKAHPLIVKEIKSEFNALLTVTDDWRFSHDVTTPFLTTHFKVHSLDGFGLKGQISAINAAGALLAYLQEELCLSIEPIKQIGTESTSGCMAIDRSTEKNLEITRSLQDGSRKNTLISVIDQTCTPMGARLLERWIKAPLIQKEEIIKRQDRVESLYCQPPFLKLIGSYLTQVRDIERLLMRIHSNGASPRDVKALQHSFEPIAYLQQDLNHLPTLSPLSANLHPLPEMIALIDQAIVEEPPAKVQDGNLFKPGFHQELDELLNLQKNSHEWLAQYQERLRAETAIKSLKVGYTKAFGYYIEVSRGQSEKMPNTFHRRQTLTNGERYITDELKNFEDKALSAQEKVKVLEEELFLKLRQQVLQFADKILQTAENIAQIDALSSLALTALQHGYVRPLVDESQTLEIIQGCHPVIQAACSHERFIPNDTLIDGENVRLMLITGPNMAGKSTYIRQVALIVILAQIGSFVPAKSAHIGLIDKVFSRIGAQDDLSRGQSTFMVEMTETANILNNKSERSLVILDEIGRGTSTYDGISIAWSVAEELLCGPNSPKTLFATHYWELTKLEEKVKGASNWHVAVHEGNDKIRFLRKLVRGSTDKSYGIHVAKLAGIPITVIERAKEILVHLEANSNQKNAFEPPKTKKKLKNIEPSKEVQLNLFGYS